MSFWTSYHKTQIESWHRLVKKINRQAKRLDLLFNRPFHEEFDYFDNHKGEWASLDRCRRLASKYIGTISNLYNSVLELQSTNPKLDLGLFCQLQFLKLGKVTVDDIVLLKEEFHFLDVDKNHLISLEEVHCAREFTKFSAVGDEPDILNFTEFEAWLERNHLNAEQKVSSRFHSKPSLATVFRADRENDPTLIPRIFKLYDQIRARREGRLREEGGDVSNTLLQSIFRKARMPLSPKEYWLKYKSDLGNDNDQVANWHVYSDGIICLGDFQELLADPILNFGGEAYWRYSDDFEAYCINTEKLQFMSYCTFYLWWQERFRGDIVGHTTTRAEGFGFNRAETAFNDDDNDNDNDNDNGNFYLRDDDDDLFNRMETLEAREDVQLLQSIASREEYSCLMGVQELDEPAEELINVEPPPDYY
eukprot:UC4_evm2s414